MGHYNAPVRRRDCHHADRGGGKGRRSSLQNLFSTKDAVTLDLNHRVPEIVGRMTLKQGKMRRQCWQIGRIKPAQYQPSCICCPWLDIFFCYAIVHFDRKM